MRVVWVSRASSDLARLHAFLAEVNPRAAKEVVRKHVATPLRLLNAPRMGERLVEFSPREIRRIFAGDYELRYELADDVIYVLRVWHVREDR